MSIGFRRTVQAILAKILFPTTRKDWYQEKGYGKNENDAFTDFLEQQQTHPDSLYYSVFKDLNIVRQPLPCLDYRKNPCTLDTITFKPTSSNNASGQGIHLVNFFGREEYYECNFRDMALEAHATGATIHAFNPPGMNSSSGQVLEFKDLVNAGIAQINKLLKDGIHPDKIILQGNCMGAAVAEEVNAHFKKHLNIEFRRINSNSFKSMNALITYLYPALLFIKDKVRKLLDYAGWQSLPGKSFTETNPYRAYMNRQNDETIRPGARLKKKIEKVRDRLKESGSEPVSYGEYDQHKQWLDDNAEMVLDTENYSKDNNINPHELDLYKLKSANEGATAFDFVNRYIDASNHYLEQHPQHVEANKLHNGAPYLQEGRVVEILDKTPEEKEEILEWLRETQSIVDDYLIQDPEASLDDLKLHQHS